jgi:Na+/proline symporter
MNALSLSFFLYTIAIFAVGIYSARFSRKTSSDFFLADRGLGPWVAALSSSASAESGWVTLGLVGTAFNTGVGAFWIVPGTVGAFVFNWLVLAPRLRRAAVQHGGLTIVDVLGQPYTGMPRTLIRVLGVLIILTMLTAYVAAQLNAAGKTFLYCMRGPVSVRASARRSFCGSCGNARQVGVSLPGWSSG